MIIFREKARQAFKKFKYLCSNYICLSTFHCSAFLRPNIFCSILQCYTCLCSIFLSSHFSVLDFSVVGFFVLTFSAQLTMFKFDLLYLFYNSVLDDLFLFNLFVFDLETLAKICGLGSFGLRNVF